MKWVGNKKLLHIKRNSNQWSLVTMAIVLFIALPVFTILIRIFAGPGESWSHLVDHVLLDYLHNSVYLVLGCGILCFLLGVSTAWVVSSYQFPFRKWFEWLLILPLSIPTYIAAYAYAGIVDYTGPIVSWSQLILGTDQVLKLDIMHVGGLTFVLSLALYPYVYVATRSMFLRQSSSILEAGSMLGAGSLRRFLRIALPLSRPAIVGGLLLVFMEVLNDYGAAKYYGVSTFTTGIFRSWFSLGEPQTAIYLSALLMLFIFLLMFLERWQRRKIVYHTGAKSGRPLRRKKLTGKKGWIAFAICFIPVLFGFILPVSQLLYWAYLTAGKVFDQAFIQIVKYSFLLAAFAAVFSIIIAILLLFSTKWNKLPIIRYFAQSALLGYAVPGAVIAIGVMVPVVAFDQWYMELNRLIYDIDTGFLLNGSLMVLVYAYCIRFLVVGYNPIDATAQKTGKVFGEAAQTLGANRWRILWQIELPLLKKGIWSGAILVFVDVMKELPLTLILKPYGITTLAIKAYEYADDELIAESALPSLLVIAIGILPVILLNKLIRK